MKIVSIRSKYVSYESSFQLNGQNERKIMNNKRKQKQNKKKGIRYYVDKCQCHVTKRIDLFICLPTERW